VHAEQTDTENVGARESDLRLPARLEQPVSTLAGAPGGGVLHRRLDPAARARAALQLQRTVGNAAVSRIVATERTLSRSPSVYEGPLQNVFAYGRDRFNGRYDGVVDAGSGTITLRMRVDMHLAPQFVDKTKGDFAPETIATFARFRLRFKEVVERIWSDAHGLKAAGLWSGPPEGFKTKVEVVFDGSNPHAEINLFPQTIDTSTGQAARSCAGAASGGEIGHASLQEGDDVEKEHTLEYKGRKQLYYGNTCAHEFGHLLGLDHVNQRAPLRKDAGGQWTDIDRYGVNPDQAMDIMGMGSVVTARDMAPFIAIAEQYGKDHAPGAEWNKWSVVGSP
jgi:hypothetical protein